MILRYTKIIGLPIFELRGQSRLGLVGDILIDQSGQKISGYLLQTPLLSFQKSRIALSVDIIETLKEVVIVKDEDAIISINEAVLAKKLYQKNYFGLGQRVVTETGLFLGKVYDYLVDNKTLGITKFYLRSLFKETIIPAKNILSFEGQTIIVKDKTSLSFKNKEAIVNEAAI